jgi:hypothetical protein
VPVSSAPSVLLLVGVIGLFVGLWMVLERCGEFEIAADGLRSSGRGEPLRWLNITDVRLTSGPIDRLLGISNIQLTLKGSCGVRLLGLEDAPAVRDAILANVEQARRGPLPPPITDEDHLLARLLGILVRGAK